ncbi:hypothetical protein L2E82_10704 [Cichorium intybus]|uniref:Uncharacterized protein n=1 Tax=Cichorium intybus TaxID=13427 RepID=A0ACB9GCI7_CICIN|nr:hypothetical protein L2E82_10704 [Cichorium intybus]
MMGAPSTASSMSSFLGAMMVQQSKFGTPTDTIQHSQSGTRASVVHHYQFAATIDTFRYSQPNILDGAMCLHHPPLKELVRPFFHNGVPRWINLKKSFFALFAASFVSVNLLNGFGCSNISFQVFFLGVLADLDMGASLELLLELKMSALLW